MRARYALLLAPLLLGACADRLENVGKPPVITPPGAPETAVGPLASARAALARRAPAAPPEDYSSASLWRSGPASLFGDRRARTIGDIVTVVIEIDDEATINNQTTRSRSGSENASVAAALGLPGLIESVVPVLDLDFTPAADFSSTSASQGAGVTDRSEEITLRVAATVTDQLPNGHLVIYGSQELRVNYELRDLQLAGIVRPEDITRQNEITLDKIADARLAYGGRGQITDLQQPRYGQQIVDAVLPW